jgi:hypothetical protein
MPDRIDCGECAGVLGCYGRCAKEAMRAHGDAAAAGQQELVIPFSEPLAAPACRCGLPPNARHPDCPHLPRAR